jgi:hypothetical protein
MVTFNPNTQRWDIDAALAKRIQDVDAASAGPMTFGLSELPQVEASLGLRRGVPGMPSLPPQGPEDNVPNVGGVPGAIFDPIAEALNNLAQRIFTGEPPIKAQPLPGGGMGLSPFPLSDSPRNVLQGIIDSLKFSFRQPRSGGTSMTMQQRTPFPMVSGGVPTVGAQVGGFIVKVWDTAPGSGVTGGGAFPIFAELADGRIAVFVDGRLRKIFRRKKPIVISRDPKLSDVRKIDNLHKRIQKTVRKILPPSRRK